jgi:hypothetical protein
MHRVQHGDVLQASDRGTHRFENKLGGDLNSSFKTEIDRAFADNSMIANVILMRSNLWLHLESVLEVMIRGL